MGDRQKAQYLPGFEPSYFQGIKNRAPWRAQVTFRLDDPHSSTVVAAIRHQGVGKKLDA
jgi:hypothetical protein